MQRSGGPRVRLGGAPDEEGRRGPHAQCLCNHLLHLGHALDVVDGGVAVADHGVDLVLEMCVQCTPFCSSEFYNKTPSHDTGHGTWRALALTHQKGRSIHENKFAACGL